MIYSKIYSWLLAIRQIYTFKRQRTNENSHYLIHGIILQKLFCLILYHHQSQVFADGLNRIYSRLNNLGISINQTIETRHFAWTPGNWENIYEIYSKIYFQTQMLLKSFLYCYLKSTMI